MSDPAAALLHLRSAMVRFSYLVEGLPGYAPGRSPALLRQTTELAAKMRAAATSDVMVEASARLSASSLRKLGDLRTPPPPVPTRLPERPALLPALLMLAPRPLQGAILPGEVYAWEPDLPHARELCIVRRVYRDDAGVCWVESWDMDYAATTHHQEDRFREACVRTVMHPHPSERPPLVNEGSVLEWLRSAAQ